MHDMDAGTDLAQHSVELLSDGADCFLNSKIHKRKWQRQLKQKLTPTLKLNTGSPYTLHICSNNFYFCNFPVDSSNNPSPVKWLIQKCFSLGSALWDSFLLSPT